MSIVPAAVTYREDILEALQEQFQTRLGEALKDYSTEEDISESSINNLRSQFTTTFANFLSTAFDVVYRNELSAKSTNGGVGNSDAPDVSAQNLSVTDDDLQNLDNSVSVVCRQRKLYPAKCAVLLEKALQYQAEAAEKIRTSIKSVPLLSDDSLPTVTSDTSANDLLSALQADVRKTISKARHIEAAAPILIDAKATLKKFEDNHHKA